MDRFSSNSKRDRMSLGAHNDTDLEELATKLSKIPNTTKSKTHDFHCPVYFQEQIFNFKLSDVFNTAEYAVLFFCPYDFTNESKNDLLHIEENFSRFLEYGAVPIAITHDQVQVHWGYASPGKTTASLHFKPSFVLASDGTNRLISASFKSIDNDTLEMKRSVAVVDRNMNTVFQYYIPQHRFFPMKSILQCFE